MNAIHQTKYVVRVTIQAAIKSLNQAIEDMPFPVTPKDREVRDAAVASVQRLIEALQAELPAVSS